VAIDEHSFQLYFWERAMGLDQYAYAVSGKFVDDNGNPDWSDKTEIGYWRKHPNLQGYMESLWRERGGEGEFNCAVVELNVEDLENLEVAVKGGAMPETQGFFFGGNSDEHYFDHDLEFIDTAKNQIHNGYEIIYTSWW
jgi:hypothetical protein